MGPLYIEMALASAIGDWLEGSGWIDILKKANTSTSGRIESFLTGKKIKRTRYAHQVSLTCLLKLSKDAFKNQEERSDKSFEEWKNEVSQTSATASFWFSVIELETLLFMLIKSLRLGYFSLFCSCLRDILPWFFALDRTHYSRWMSVFLEDILRWISTCPFGNGYGNGQGNGTQENQFPLTGTGQTGKINFHSKSARGKVNKKYKQTWRLFSVNSAEELCIYYYCNI